MSHPGGIVAAVLGHANARPEGTCFHLVSNRERESTASWATVAQDAERAAGFLASTGIGKGDVVVLTGTHHDKLHACWLGAVWLGAVPTILAEPSVRVDREVYWSRLAELLAKINAKALLADPKIKLDASGPTARYTYVEVVEGAGAAPKPFVAGPDDLLLLQHSSGTTGLQKGVMLTHRAVEAHAESYLRSAGLDSSAVIASWLPLYHDMGMIACFVTPLYAGIEVAWLSPFEWVANPSLLLKAVTKHEATHTWLPNFAYAFLAQRVNPAELELSSLRAVINCSEPVTAEAMDAFAGKFASAGLSRDALHACYAMAENVFAVTTSNPANPMRRLSIDRAKWHSEHRAVPSNAADALVHPSNGPVIDGVEVRIVARDSEARLSAFEAGRVLIKSPFMFSGYFERKELNDHLFDAGGFYDTGDLGYLDDGGHLYVTGRSKDLVIIGGRNVYPQDVEAVINAVGGVHPGRVVVFGVPHKGLSTEGLVALAESDEPEGAWPDLVRKLRGAVPSKLDLDLLDARIVPQGQLRKSTSGKLARNGNREWYLAGRFGPVPEQVETSK